MSRWELADGATAPADGGGKTERNTWKINAVCGNQMRRRHELLMLLNSLALWHEMCVAGWDALVHDAFHVRDSFRSESRSSICILHVPTDWLSIINPTEVR